MDLFLALLGLAFTGTVYWSARGFADGARFFPVRVLALLALSFTCLLIKSLKRERKERVELDRQAVGVVIFSCLYLWGISHWGYVVSSALFFLCTTLMLGFKRYVLSLVVSVAFAIGIYLLFTKLLLVPLPALLRGGLL